MKFSQALQLYLYSFNVSNSLLENKIRSRNKLSENIRKFERVYV